MSGYRPLAFARPSFAAPSYAIVARELVRPLSERETLIKKLRERRAEGVSQNAIADEFRVNRNFVQRSTRGVKPPPQGWPTGARPTRFNVAKAQRMRRAGFTFNEIAEDLNCSQRQARRIVSGDNGCTRGKGRRPTWRYEQVVQRATGVRSVDMRTRLEAGSRRQDFVDARAILVWLIRQREPKLSFPRMARCLGGFDHTTLLHQLRRAEAVHQRIGLVEDQPTGRTCKALWRVFRGLAA